MYQNDKIISVEKLEELNNFKPEAESYQRYFEEKATGSTFKAISMNVISNTVIPLPPLAEQHRIVDKLYKIFEKIESMKI